MATGAELKVVLNTSLYRLLVIQKENKGIRIKGLNKAITEAKVTMSAEDVAYVEKLAEETTED
jgi:hypothetical protein